MERINFKFSQFICFFLLLSLNYIMSEMSLSQKICETCWYLFFRNLSEACRKLKISDQSRFGSRLHSECQECDAWNHCQSTFTIKILIPILCPYSKDPTRVLIYLIISNLEEKFGRFPRHLFGEVFGQAFETGQSACEFQHRETLDLPPNDIQTNLVKLHV